MKNLKINVIRAFALTIVLFVSGIGSVSADDNGFTLEDAIRYQIFQELKINVKHLYENSRLIVPEVDTSVAERVAENRPVSGFQVTDSINSNDVNAVSKNEVIN